MDEPATNPLLSTDLPVTLPRGPAGKPTLPGPGTRLLNGRFELEQCLGQGGMGMVFRALDLEAKKLKDPSPRLALKMLSEEVVQSLPEARIVLQRELSRARKLTHPNIVSHYEYYEDRGVAFITMELLEGRPWDALIESHPQGMPLDEARPLVEQLCAALSYAHGQGVIHSDLKPQNLFLTDARQVKVLDFGIAARRPAADGKSVDTVYNPRQMLAMTRRYACAEMWQGLDADPRDDVYSAACIVYELLAGVHPLGGADAMEAFQQQLVPPPIRSLSKAQNRALRRALAPLRAQRTPSIERFGAELWAPDPFLRRRQWILAGSMAGLLASAAMFLAHHAPGAAPHAPGAVSRAGELATIPGDSARSLARLLGMTETPFEPAHRYTRDEVLAAVARSPRRVVLGSSKAQIAAALALCQETSRVCKADWYADETLREPVLQPFSLDPTAVTVGAFRQFVISTGYRTEAELAGRAYAFWGGELHPMPGGNWMNAAGTGLPSDQSAVVGVSFADAQAYCHWRGARLPTEDEWEYAARGPRASIFPWGDDPGPARVHLTARPAAADGPHEGVDGRLRGLAGNVWEWVNSPAPGNPGRMILKGGSWLEDNPANKRAAARRFEIPTRADSDSGFRCARSVPQWPDASFWVRTLR